MYIYIIRNNSQAQTHCFIICMAEQRTMGHLPRLFHGWIRVTCRFASASVSWSFCRSTWFVTGWGDSTRSTLFPGPGSLRRTTGSLWRTTGADIVTETPEGKSVEELCSPGRCKPCRVQLSSNCWCSFSSSSGNRRTDEHSQKTVRFYQLAPAVMLEYPMTGNYKVSSAFSISSCRKKSTDVPPNK